MLFSVSLLFWYNPSSEALRATPLLLLYNPSGNASLPDYFFLLSLRDGKRWGDVGLPPKPAWGPKPGAPSGRRSPAERRESQGAPQRRDYASSPDFHPQTPSLLRARENNLGFLPPSPFFSDSRFPRAGVYRNNANIEYA